MSNPEYPGRIKVGKTKEEPVIRAKALSRQTATLGEYKVELENGSSRNDCCRDYFAL